MNEHFLEVRGAEFRYGPRQVLGDVDLTVRQGEIYVLLGPNGAGKSTLARAVSGQIRLDQGHVRVAGADPAKSADARRAIGIVPQNIALYDKLNARENLNVIGRLMGVPRRSMGQRIGVMLEKIRLGDRAADRAEILSGGMRRRLNIAAALLHEPQLLILDEPTVGVDRAGRHAVRELLIALRDGGLAILLTTHDMDEAQALADRVGIMVEGRLKAEGTPEELVEKSFGDAIEVIVQPGGSGAPLEGVGKSMGKLGLRYDATTGQWRGLVDQNAPQIQKLIQKVARGDTGASDIRVRRPGLDTLLDRLTARQDGTP